MNEEKAKKILTGIQNELFGKEIIARYSKLDLIRFANMAKENPEMSPSKLVRLYDAKHPRLTALQGLKNLDKALNLNIDFGE